MKKEKVLLYSGGMDSWLIDKLWKPDRKIYVDIHGGYNEAEKSRLPDDVQIVDFPLLGNFELDNKFVPLRNLYFLMIGSHFGNEVCLGAVAGDGSKDKSPYFLNRTNEILADLWHDKKIWKDVKVCTDFIYMSKTELIEAYIAQGGTIDEIRKGSFSCYTPDEHGNECFDCYPCFRKFALLFAHGARYTKEERTMMWQYIKRQIIPTREQGGYQGTYYTDRGEESRDLVFAVETLKKEFEP